MAKRTVPGIKFRVEQLCKKNDVDPLCLFAVFFDVFGYRMTNFHRGWTFGEKPPPEGDEHLLELLTEVQGEAGQWAEESGSDPKWPSSIVELVEMIIANKYWLAKDGEEVERRQGPEHAAWAEQMAKAYRVLLAWLREVQNDGERGGILARLHAEERGRRTLMQMVKSVRDENPAATHFSRIFGQDHPSGAGQFFHDDAAIEALADVSVEADEEVFVFRIEADGTATRVHPPV